MSRRLALSFIVVGALVGACADEPTAPRVAPLAGAAGPSSQLGLPTLRSNSVKYRDAGMKPATGRSGSATLAARALQGPDGLTTLEVTTGSFESAAAAPGNIDKVQVRLLENNKVGRQFFSRNISGLTGGGTWSQVLPVGAGRTIQVQANVRGIDGSRTDVVVVRERVKRRPDLVVDEVYAPEKAAPGAYVQIGAVVSELNGDVGARANCVLYVDKVAVDRANGIWVDAGRTVSCAFGHRFAAAGAHAVRVEVEGVNPGDWNPENNALSRSVLVEDASAVFFAAEVEDFTRTTRLRTENSERWEDNMPTAYTSTNITDNTSMFRRRHALTNTYTQWKLDGSLALPLRQLAVSHSSGTLSASASFTDVAATQSLYEYEPGEYEEERKCAKGYADGSLGIVMIDACLVRRRNLAATASAGDPPADGKWYTRFEVQSVDWPGDVVYNSLVEASRYVDDVDPSMSCNGGPDGTYCYYNVTSSSEPPNAEQIPPLGSSYLVNVTIAGADGAAQEVRADIPLDQPYRPFELPDGSFTNRIESNGCETQTTDMWAEQGWRYITTQCTLLQKVASGNKGAFLRLQPAPAP